MLAARSAPNLRLRLPAALRPEAKGARVLGSLSGSIALARAAGMPAVDVCRGPMTANKRFKRRVRDRARKTGESYTAALAQLRRGPERERSMSEQSTGTVIV